LVLKAQLVQPIYPLLAVVVAVHILAVAVVLVVI
jgi:hypothetical protein